MYSIETINISKKFGQNIVFENLNFCAENGKITSILGPSGKGKSTLLRCLVGLEKIDKGEIKIFGESLNKENEDNLLKNIGFVFQNLNLFNNLTVIDNLKIVSNSSERMQKLICQFRLEGKENEFPRNLSGGQKQRVAIARALMLDPKILIFDEPTSALDRELVLEFVEIVKNLSKSGKSIIIVTHNIKFAELTSDNIFNM